MPVIGSVRSKAQIYLKAAIATILIFVSNSIWPSQTESGVDRKKHLEWLIKVESEISTSISEGMPLVNERGLHTGFLSQDTEIVSIHVGFADYPHEVDVDSEECHDGPARYEVVYRCDHAVPSCFYTAKFQSCLMTIH